MNLSGFPSLVPYNLLMRLLLWMKQMISFYYSDPTALVVVFFYRPPQSLLVAFEPFTNTRSLRSLTAAIMPIVWTAFLLKTENSVVCEGFRDLLSSEVLFMS